VTAPDDFCAGCMGSTGRMHRIVTGFKETSLREDYGGPARST
jgi:hypothetical protein